MRHSRYQDCPARQADASLVDAGFDRRGR